MIAAIKKLFKNEKGQSLVETAVVLPILLTLFCGIVDFGWIMGNQIIAENGCREGARLGAVVASKSDYATQVQNRVIAVTPTYSHTGITVTTALSSPGSPSNGDVVVTVVYKFQILTPIAQILLGEQQYTVTSTCTMKAE